MARKTKQIKEEVEKAKKKAEEALAKQQEVEQLVIEAEEEERAILDRTKESIENLCNADNLFCGVVITTEDIMMLLRQKLSIGKDENIKIPFHIYFND